MDAERTGPGPADDEQLVEVEVEVVGAAAGPVDDDEDGAEGVDRTTALRAGLEDYELSEEDYALLLAEETGAAAQPL